MVPTPLFVDSTTEYSTYEPVEANARHERVEAPTGMLTDPPDVDETPVAVLELYGTAATFTVDLKVNETEAELAPPIDAVIVGDSAVASVTLIHAIPLELKFAADKFQAAPAVELVAVLLTA